MAGEGGAVPDRLHPEERPLSIQECVPLVSEAQLRSLTDTWVPLKHNPEGTRVKPREMHALPPPNSGHTDERGTAILGFPPSDSQTKGLVGKEKIRGY